MSDVKSAPLTNALDLSLPHGKSPKTKSVRIKAEPPRAASPKAEASKAEPPKSEASKAEASKAEPPKASKAEASKAEPLSVDSSAESTPFVTPITSPEVKTLLSGTELKKEILSKPEVKSDATPPAYTEADATRGKQLAAKETVDAAAMAKDEAELNAIINNLPKNVKAEINNLYKEFDAPPSYSKLQIAQANKVIYDTYEGIHKLRALSAEDMKKMAGTQYGIEGLLTVTKQRLTTLTNGLVHSGVSIESAKKINNNIIKALIAAGERDADKFGDSIAKSKPHNRANSAPKKMMYESFDELLLK